MKALCLGGLTVALLAGCAGHTHSLVAEESDRAFKGGLFRHEGRDGPTMILELAGTRFEAHGFAISRIQNLAELRRQYFPGKHYERIFSGMDTDHYVYTAEPELRAGNGTALRCSAIWRANGSPAGHCVTAEGTHINFRFE
ncbi:hypothetical protein [Sulfuritalea sp.]|uniref:hypothetical protein n=1 Tax=Sulfuritalea sp. TaxID=2480090 RepID=UPI00286DCC3B|nr:hypothetical protein [Sulfuritalea sp.]